MSRFAYEVNDGRLVTYGLDHALGYFAQVFIKGIEHPVRDVTGRNAVLELLENEGLIEVDNINTTLNEWHIKSIVMDLPIASNEEEFNDNMNAVLDGKEIIP